MNDNEADAGLSLRFVEQENARQELFQSVSLSAQDAEQMHANTIADRLFTQGALGAGGVAGGLGIDLLKGIGGPEENAFGIMNVAQAAELGSDVGAYILGEAFFHGRYNLPNDPVRARFWLEKVVHGECEIKHLGDEGIAKSAEMLRELDD